jgi:hypothetical protein
MKILEFIFHLGVVYAIFGFLWWIPKVIIFLLSKGKAKSEAEVYILKLINYFFLVSITFRFSSDSSLGIRGMDELEGILIGGSILLMFLLGKIQKNEQQFQMMQAFPKFLKNSISVFNRKLEILMVAIAISFFVLFYFYPLSTQNLLTNWFVESIVNIADTPVFGFIFKIFGFFFLLRILTKFIGGILQLLGIKKTRETTATSSFSGMFSNQNDITEDDNKKNDDDFDDYEEVK